MRNLFQPLSSPPSVFAVSPRELVLISPSASSAPPRETIPNFLKIQKIRHSADCHSANFLSVICPIFFQMSLSGMRAPTAEPLPKRIRSHFPFLISTLFAPCSLLPSSNSCAQRLSPLQAS